MVKWNQPANALWLDQAAPPGEAVAGQTQHFESVPAAVRFIKEDLTPALRADARIITDDGALTVEEVERINADRLVLAAAVNAETLNEAPGVTAAGLIAISGEGDIAELEAALGRLATEGLLVTSDESPRWFVTDAGKQAASE